MKVEACYRSAGESDADAIKLPIRCMKPQTRLELHKYRRRMPVIAAALSFIGFGVLAGPEITKGDTSPWSQWLGGDTMTGDWGGLRTTLLDHGLKVSGGYDAEGWGNTTGGLEQGAVYTGLLYIALQLDLQKAIGWPGASLDTRWVWINGQDASAHLAGNFLTISNIAGYNTVRAYELWFQQNWLDDAISLRLGQVAADTDFLVSKYASTFLNSTFGWPASMALNLPGGGPGYPMSTLGIRLALNPAGWFTFQTAVFQGNVYPQNVNLHGFRWRLNGANGFFFLNEVQFRWNQRAEDTGLPGQLSAGAWYHTARFARSDDAGSVRGNYGVYAMLDQMLYREPGETAAPSSAPPPDGKKVSGAAAAKKSDQGLGVFGRIASEPQDRNFMGLYFDTGLTCKGLIPTRDADTLGVGFAYAQLSSGAKRAATHAGSVGVSAEMALEATYQAQITPWLSVQPDLQYIINPGGSQNLGNALVPGCRVAVTF